MLVCNACNHKIAAPPANVLNSEALHHIWKVVEMHGAVQPLGSVFLDLRDVMHTHASAGCDSVIFTPKYGYNNRVDFTSVQVAVLMCKGRTLLDQQLLTNLNAVYYFSVASNHLSLYDENRTRLFEAVYHPDDEQGTIKRRWMISGMLNGNNKTLLANKAYIDFTDLSGTKANAGCNQLVWSTILSNTHHISFGEVSSTKIPCQYTSNEEVLLKILPLVKAYQVTGNRLQLFDSYHLLLLEAIAPLQ